MVKSEVKMNKLYKVSRIILSIMSFIIFNIMFINEDSSWLILPPIFALITFGLSFPSTVVSKRIITVGNTIDSKLLKVLYYLVLPIILVLICAVVSVIFLLISENLPTTNDFSSALSQVFFVIFCVIIVWMGIVLPYIQTLVVLILKQFKK